MGDSDLEGPASVAWCLRATVALQCVGAFWQSRVGESAIFEYLWLQAGVAESMALVVADVGSWFVLAAGLLTVAFVRRWWLYPLAVWFAAVALAETVLGGSPFATWTLPADAVRIAVPLALVWLADETSARRPSPEWTERFLALAVVATFATHGWEAFQLHPRFGDYLYVASETFLGARFESTTVTVLLTAIGIVDLVVAGTLLLGRRWRLLLGYMAFWGGLAACARIVHGGWWGLPKCLVRAANAGAPLALFLWHRDGSPDDTSFLSAMPKCQESDEPR
jgi:hypothetical protein